MGTRRVTGLGLVVLLALTGCGGRMQAGGGETLPLDARDVLRLRMDVTWACDLAAESDELVESAVILDDMIVLVQGPSNMVSAVSLADGRILWRHLVGTPTDRLFMPFRVGERVYINSESELFALSADDGRLLRIMDFRQSVAAGPALLGQLAIFGGVNARVFAHDLRRGYERWSYLMPASVVTQPVLVDINAFVADVSGVYAMLNGSNGDMQYKGRTFGRISVPAAISPNSIYIASEDQTLYCLERATGRDKWKYFTPRPLTLPPVAFRNNLYLPIPGEGLIALDARTGTEIWRYPGVATPILLTDDRLFLHDRSSLIVLDPPSGKALMQSPIEPLCTVLPTKGDGMVMVTVGGRLLRVQPLR